MAGARHEPDAAVLVPPMQETQPECSGAAAAQLESILSNVSPQKALCREWCGLAAAAGLRAPLRQAVGGALNRAARNMRPRRSEIDWNRTIRANLRHYQPELGRSFRRPG